MALEVLIYSSGIHLPFKIIVLHKSEIYLSLSCLRRVQAWLRAETKSSASWRLGWGSEYRSSLFSCLFRNFFFRCTSMITDHVMNNKAVADRVLVLQLGVRPEPLRWESWVQDIGPPETSQPHIISTGERSSRDLCLNAKTQLHSTRASSSAEHSMPDNYQDKNTTLPISREAT